MCIYFRRLLLFMVSTLPIKWPLVLPVTPIFFPSSLSSCTLPTLSSCTKPLHSSSYVFYFPSQMRSVCAHLHLTSLCGFKGYSSVIIDLTANSHINVNTHYIYLLVSALPHSGFFFLVSFIYLHIMSFFFMAE